MTRALYMSCAILMSSPAAYAQEPAEPPPPEQPAAEPAEAPPPRTWTVGLGLGVVELTGETGDDASDVGLYYEVRAGFRTRSLIGVEAAFIGTAQSANALGLDPDADLRSYGAEVVARLNLERVVAADAGPVRITPFLLAGVAFQRFKLSYDGQNTSAIADDDNVLSIPIGAGVAGTMQWLDTGLRFTWRRTFDNDLFRDPAGGRADASLSHWNLSAHAAFAF